LICVKGLLLFKTVSGPVAWLSSFEITLTLLSLGV
jgi:hypothetical protein